MQEVYGALLLHSAKLPVNEENLDKVLRSVGVAPDNARVKALVASLEGQNIDELIKQAAVVQAAAPSAGGEAKKEEKKSEEDEAKAAETASAGLSSLFG
ncbi:MAG TPA: 50S ribosomal protein L12 [archaeon]|nr:50S ribosomal protein L12 [archaeon]